MNCLRGLPLIAHNAIARKIAVCLHNAHSAEKLYPISVGRTLLLFAFRICILSQYGAPALAETPVTPRMHLFQLLANVHTELLTELLTE